MHRIPAFMTFLNAPVGSRLRSRAILRLARTPANMRACGTVTV